MLHPPGAAQLLHGRQCGVANERRCGKRTAGKYLRAQSGGGRCPRHSTRAIERRYGSHGATTSPDPRGAIMTLSPSPPVLPMEALSVEDIPTGPDWQYEPKWDGFRCLLFR